ncbi:MAG TPA: hypothetical protein VMA77_14600 [Solirubrobacteraceae bacterium]|nr:hypothetical protein [Solirubrobacteraceae bacterium]
MARVNHQAHGPADRREQIGARELEKMASFLRDVPVLSGLQHGSISFIHFLGAHSLEISASSSGPLTADVSEDADTTGATISGIADVPSGATVKLRDDATDQQIDLRTRPFSINATSRLGGDHRRDHPPAATDTRAPHVIHEIGY